MPGPAVHGQRPALAAGAVRVLEAQGRLPCPVGELFGDPLDDLAAFPAGPVDEVPAVRDVHTDGLRVLGSRVGLELSGGVPLAGSSAHLDAGGCGRLNAEVAGRSFHGSLEVPAVRVRDVHVERVMQVAVVQEVV